MKSPTLDEIFAKAWKDHWDTPRYQTSGHAKEVFRNYHNHLKPTFGSRGMAAITSNHIRRWHCELVARPYAANRSLEALSRLFQFYLEEGFSHPQGNPCRLVKAHVERKRGRFASVSELVKVGEILKREYEANPIAITFIYTLAFSGARPRSIERARWEQLGDNGVMVFEGKSGWETVVFPPKALELILKLPKENELVFGGIKMPRRLWNKIRKEAGCPDLWARDLRRTFASVGLSLGGSMDTIGELLNHKSTQTTKLYAKLLNGKKLESAREIAEEISKCLDGISEKKEVV